METAEVHGWRAYTLAACSKLDSRPVLVGAYGMHVHSKDSPKAECRGFNFASAPWVTGEPEAHEEWEVPHLMCSCGYRGLLTMPEATENRDYIAHVTALGNTWIHDEGFRTAKYTIDFFLKPKFANIQVFDTKTGIASERFSDANLVLIELAKELEVPIYEENNCEQCGEGGRASHQSSINP